MAFLIARNATVSIRLGQFQDGSAPSYGSSVALICLARSYSREVTFGTTETGAICDKFQKTVVTRGSGTIEMELVIESSSVSYPQASRFVGKEGYYLEVTYTPNTGATAIVDVGVITKVGQRLDIDGIQTESLSVALSVLGVATT